MKNINLKLISKGIIVLLSAISAYFILVVLAIIINTLNGIGASHEPEFEFEIDKNDQKFLIKKNYHENTTKVFDLDLNLLVIDQIESSADFSKKYLDWDIKHQNVYKLSKSLSNSCISLSEHYTRGNNELWYYMPQQKYFIGYERSSAKIVGYFGLNGFVKQKKDVSLFANVKYLEPLGEGQYSIISENKAYSIQLQNRKIIFLHQEKAEQIKSISAKFEVKLDYSKYSDTIGFAVCTDKQIVTYDSDGKIKSTAIFPKGLQLKSLHRYAFNGKHYIHYIKTILESESKSESESVINELSASGEVLWSFIFKNNRFDKGINITPLQVTIPFMGCVTINFLSRFYEVDLLQESTNPLEHATFRRLGEVNFIFWITLLITAGCMLFVFSHLHKRTDSKHTMTLWMLIIFVFSIPGVLAYLIYYGNSKTIVCTHCGKKFLPIKNSCLICSKEIPMGKTDGREIFSAN